MDWKNSKNQVKEFENKLKGPVKDLVNDIVSGRMHTQQMNQRFLDLDLMLKEENVNEDADDHDVDDEVEEDPIDPINLMLSLMDIANERELALEEMSELLEQSEHQQWQQHDDHLVLSDEEELEMEIANFENVSSQSLHIPGICLCTVCEMLP